MTITEPGIYTMTAEEYHADACPEPSLSRGIAHMLILQSPMHAHYHHPRLGGGKSSDANKAMDAGSAVHSMVLGVGAEVVPLKAVYGPKHERAGEPVTDYATKDAKTERDALREAGHIPCLAHELADLRRCAASITRNLRWHQDGADFFGPGQSEAVVIWKEGSVWMRCMVDRLPDDPSAPPFDLKLTKMSAAPTDWERRYRTAYAFQDAFYRRGIAAIRGRMPPPMRFAVGEINPPHGVSVMCSAPSLAALSEADVERSINIWSRCMASGEWPGYPQFTAHVEATSWQISQAEEAAMREDIMEAAQ